MLGSILSNLLLVLGMCFFLGGVTNMTDERGRGSEQIFASGTAQTACSLMTLSTASMVIPATLAMVIERGPNPGSAKESILVLSRGTAIILLFLYVLYLYFQLRTHKNLFNPEVPDVEDDEDEHDEQEEASMSAWSAAAVLIGVTIVISLCADYLVDSIDAIVATGAISKNFIGMILIPIVGNAAEHVTACVVAVRNKMDLAMGVAVGSSVQIALLVTPFLVLLGWAMGKEMDLQFETCRFSLSMLFSDTNRAGTFADALLQSRLFHFSFLCLWSRIPFLTENRTTLRAPCCLDYMSLLRSHFTPCQMTRWMGLVLPSFRFCD